jgi:hypothetical protein
MSSSNGLANSIVSRIESAPHRSTSGIGSTTLPFDFDIEAPPKITCPWFNRRGNGSWNGTRPASWSALVKNRA